MYSKSWSPEPPVDLIAGRYAGDYQLELLFNTGERRLADPVSLILGPNPGIFAPLQDVENFKRFQLQWDTVDWPEIGELDIAPEALYEKYASKSGSLE